MSKEKPTEKTPAPVSKPSVVSGGFQDGARAPRRRRLKPLVIGIVIVIGLALVGYAVYEQFDQDGPAIDMSRINVDQIPDEYEVMTEPEIAYVVYQRTGLTVEQLRNRSIDSRLLKDYEAAYNVGQALHQLSERQKAFEAYRVAADYAGDELTYEFALKYIEAARFAQAQDEALWMLERAKKMVADNKDMNDIDKQQESEKLEQMIRDVRAGY